jgi:hypothetical protein
MGAVDTVPSDAQQRQAGSAGKQLRVFINYRHNDTGLGAQLLHDRKYSEVG